MRYPIINTCMLPKTPIYTYTTSKRKSASLYLVLTWVSMPARRDQTHCELTECRQRRSHREDSTLSTSQKALTREHSRTILLFTYHEDCVLIGRQIVLICGGHLSHHTLCDLIQDTLGQLLSTVVYHIHRCRPWRLPATQGVSLRRIAPGDIRHSHRKEATLLEFQLH